MPSRPVTAAPLFSAAWTVLRAGAVAAAPLACVAPLGLAPLFALAALAAVALAWARQAKPPLALGLLVAATLALASASVAWAVDARLALRLLPSFTAMMIGGAALLALARRLEPRECDALGSALLAGFFAAIALVSIEAGVDLVTGTSLRGWLVAPLGLRHTSSTLNRSLAVLAILVWPAAIVLWGRGWRRTAACLPLWLALLTLRFDSMAAELALVSSGAAAAGVAVLGSHLRPVLIASLCIGIAIAPALPRWPVVYDNLSRRELSVSIWHRAEIWAFTAARIAERPMLGWGFNASRALPGGNQLVADRAERLPLHPHNAILQLWVELGGIGAALGAILIAMCASVTTSGRLARVPSAGATACLMAALAAASTGYGLWQGWWIATLWLAAFFVAVALKASQATHDAP